MSKMSKKLWATAQNIPNAKQELFNEMCKVLVKQAKLHDGFELMSAMHQDEINLQTKEFKNKCKIELMGGKKVFDCAKQFYTMHHLNLIRQTDQWGYTDYNLYLESIWLTQSFLDLTKYDAVRRVIHLINNPNKGYTPAELYQHCKDTVLVSEAEAEPSIQDNINLLDWQINMLWEMFNPVTDLNTVPEITEGMGVSNGKLNYEIADERYIKDLLKERTKLLKLKEAGELNSEDSNALKVISEVISEIFGYKPGKKKGFCRSKSRMFRDNSLNQAYSCIKMSIKRLATSFPEGSLERRILEKNIHYKNGRFYWGEPESFAEDDVR